MNLSRHCPAFFTPLPRASMFFVYVLHSQSSGKRYIGQTADLDRRLKEHNDPSHNLAKYNSRNAAPWILLHREQNETRAAAMSQEKWLKSGVGREWPHAQFDRTGPPLNHGLTQRRKGAKNSTHRSLTPSFASSRLCVRTDLCSRQGCLHDQRRHRLCPDRAPRGWRYVKPRPCRRSCGDVRNCDE